MLNGGYVSIGWPELGNLKEYEEQDKTSLKARLVNELENKRPNTPQVIGKSVNQILSFYFNIMLDDIIVAVDGETVSGVGKAVGAYEYRDGLPFPNLIKVNWIYKVKTRLPIPREGILTTVYQYKEIDNILSIAKLAVTPFTGTQNGGSAPLALTPL